MEGLDETLTLHRLGVFHEQPQTTNLIESMMARVEEKTARVDHWRTSEQKQRWCAGAMLEHARRFRRVKGYQHLPLLARALANGHIEIAEDTSQDAAAQKRASISHLRYHSNFNRTRDTPAEFLVW